LRYDVKEYLMARHDVDPVLRQLIPAINESGQATDAADDRGPFERLLGGA
jgi:hypothetical protein